MRVTWKLFLLALVGAKTHSWAQSYSMLKTMSRKFDIRPVKLSQVVNFNRG